MAEEVFHRERVRPAKVFHSDNAYLFFPRVAGTEVAVSAAGAQQISGSYSQQVGRLYDLAGSENGQGVNVYYTIGRTAGQLSVSHVVGPVIAVKSWYRQFGDGCRACLNEMAIRMNAGNCCNADSPVEESIGYHLYNMVMTAMGFSMGAEQMLIMHTVSIIYTGMEYE